jgi:hypothetical protein
MPHALLLLPAPQEACPLCDAHELLALRVLEERGKGAASAWAAYLALLPAAPLTSGALSERDVALLQGTYAGVIVGGVRRRLQRFVQRVRSASAAAFKDSALHWAMAVVLSRALVVGAPGRLAARNVSHARLYDTPFLAPGADLFNHSPEAAVGWTLSAEAAASVRQLAGNSVAAAAAPAKGAAAPPPAAALPVFAIVALQGYPAAGVEVFNSYHDAAGNAHLLAHHGFTLRDNAFDSIALQFSGSGSGGGGWFSLVTASLEEAWRGVSVRLRSLRERGLVGDSDVDAAVQWWSAPAALASPNVTVLLHAGWGGRPPQALLNLARMTVLTSSGALAAWADGSAAGSAPAAALTSADASRVRGSLAAQAERALWARVLAALPEAAQQSEGAASAAFEVSGGTGASAPLPSLSHSPSHGHGGSQALDTGHLLSLPLSVSLATDALAHSMLLNSLAGLRRAYRRRAAAAAAEELLGEAGSSSGSGSGAGGGDDAALAAVRQRIRELETACLESGAGMVGAGWASHSSGAASGQGRTGIDSAAAVAAAAPAALHQPPTESPAPAAAAGVAPRAPPPKATPLPLARARAAAEAAARDLPELERRAAVLALRVAERKILAQLIAQLLESYRGIAEQLRRTTGGADFLAPLTAAQDFESANAGDDDGRSAVLGSLELALAFAEGHADSDSEGEEGEGAAAAAAAGAGAAAAATSGHGHLRTDAGSHRGESS